ncbi:putative glutamine synthetase [Aspergillus floccosus]
MAPQLDCYAGHFTTTPVPPDPSSLLRGFLTDHPRVRFVRLQWQDYSGLLRARLVVPSHLLTLMVTNTPVHMPPIAFHCIVDNTLLPNVNPTGNHFLIPDWASLRLLPGAAHPTAVVMCGVLATTPGCSLPDLSLCPRRALASIVHHAEHHLNLDFRVGFEVEFEVFHRAVPPIPSQSNSAHSPITSELFPASTSLGRFAADGLRADIFVFLEEAVHTLLDAGVGIQTMQTEGRRGQYELSLAPRPPLDAIDELVLVHDTLKRMLARHGLVVTMAPRPIANRRQATGQHTHFSVSRPEVATEFLAGILGRLPGLCAVCLPYEVSYERVQPYLGGEVVAWGTEDRTVPMRAVGPGHWEMRCVDATANMYLALAAVLGAGVLGVENGEALQWRDSSNRTNSACRDGYGSRCSMNANSKANGVLAGLKSLADEVPLPRSLDAALDLLEKEIVPLSRIMDSAPLEQFLRVKRFERSTLARMDSDDVRTMLAELF